MLACAGSALAECRARAEGPPPRVIELYTSEGCESCPPVDRWLSGLKGASGVLPFAFHIDYFDRLGWKDRFSNAAFTRRQKEALEASGAREIYTPQVLIDGRDKGQAPPAAAAPDARIALTVARDGEQYVATLVSQAAQPIAFTGFWALTENGLVTQVRGGENAGTTLAHDFVVREYRKLKPASIAPGASAAFDFAPPPPAPNREIAFVVADPASGRPLQALRMPAC
jgi:hypothetical protein